MGAPEDTKSRLESIDEACKKEIASKKNEIEKKQQELHQKQHVSGITREQESQYNQEIAKFQKELDGLSKNQMALSKLTSAIYAAFNEIQEWTPGIIAAVSVVEEYNMYLKSPKKADAIVTQSSTALNLLADEIKSHSADKSAGARIISALQGIGLALAGLVLGTLAVPATIILHLGDIDNDIASMWKFVGNLFVSAFDSFKETWSGKVEPPELKKLSHELNTLNKQYSQVTSTANHPHAFLTPKKGSHDDENPELGNLQTPSK
jgi:hypothetical protein